MNRNYNTCGCICVVSGGRICCLWSLWRRAETPSWPSGGWWRSWAPPGTETPSPWLQTWASTYGSVCSEKCTTALLHKALCICRKKIILGVIGLGFIYMNTQYSPPESNIDMLSIDVKIIGNNLYKLNKDTLNTNFRVVC